MEISPEQQKALDEQKAQCIFCQLIAGKMPSKKVFSDDKLIGLLDINPASQGHTLFMPKEHYPIMPLIPQDTFKQMFVKTKELDQCIKKAMLCDQNTIFIANGGAAGQQSMHFMLHIIPRNKGDGLLFDQEGAEPSEQEQRDLIEKTGGILNAMLNKNLSAMGYIKPKTTGNNTGTTNQLNGKMSKEQLLQLINANPQIKQLIIEKTEEFKQMLPQHGQLKQIFEGHDIDEIISIIKNQEKPQSGKKLGFDQNGGGN